jgi:hypothetical protein
MQAEKDARVSSNNGKLRYIVGGLIGLAIAGLLVAGGFVEGLISGCIAAVPAVLGINLLVLAFRRK